MAAAKKNLGKMPCPHCGDPVAVMQAETGTLSYKCQDADCESSGFAAGHTGAARKWLASTARPAAKAPAAPVVDTAITTPEKKAEKPAFSMGNL